MFERQPADMTRDQCIDEALALSESLQQAGVTASKQARVGRRMQHLFFEVRFLQGEYDHVLVEQFEEQTLAQL